MKFDSHLNYQTMYSLSAKEVRPLLGEIKSIIELRLKQTLSEFGSENFKSNQGALDKNYVHVRSQRAAFFGVVEEIASELNELGHKLFPLDEDNDIDFESTSISWATAWMDNNPNGLDLEIFPNKVQVLWVLSPDA